MMTRALPHETEHNSDESPYYFNEDHISYVDHDRNETCSCCYSFKPTLLRWYWSCTLVKLEDASQNGCPRCKSIYELIKVFAPNAFQGSSRMGISEKFECDLRINAGVRAREESYRLEIFRLYETNSNSEVLNHVPIKYITLGDTGSEKTLDCIKKWIQKCDSEHTACAPTPLLGQFQGPKRILELQSGIVKLRENLREKYSYACLSHCWGNTDAVPKTVASTIEIFKGNIPTKVLTKTFQDAIDLCRRLKIYYLWIDSLCIKQDNEEDWKTEAPRMADIYEAAILTIAASKSTDGSGGLYAKSKHPIYTSSNGLSIREMNPVFPFQYGCSLKPWPLLQRGWVFQERLLSRRMLHFGTEEIIWECKTHSACENQNSYQKSTSTNEDDLPRTWRDYVSQYSKLQITFEKDRLVALSGVAKKAAVLRSNDRYIAGLWAKSLLYDLVWIASNKISARSSNFHAPTWSWASIKGEVLWDSKTGLSVLTGVEVVDVSCPIVYTGHVSCDDNENPGPTITIRAPLMAAKFAPKTPPTASKGGMEDQDGERDYYHGIKLVAEHEHIFRYCSIYFPPDYLFHVSGRYYVGPESELFVLPLLIHSVGYDCLLLRKLYQKNLFERLSLVRIFQFGSEALMELLRTHVHSLPLTNVTIA